MYIKGIGYVKQEEIFLALTEEEKYAWVTNELEDDYIRVKYSKYYIVGHCDMPSDQATYFYNLISEDIKNKITAVDMIVLINMMYKLSNGQIRNGTEVNTPIWPKTE